MVIIKSIIIYEQYIIVLRIRRYKNNLPYKLCVYLKTFKKRRLFNIIKSNHRNYLYVYALLN